MGLISKLINIDKTELHQPKSIWSTFKNAYLRRKNLKKFWKTLDKKNLPEELIKISDLFLIYFPQEHHLTKKILLLY